MTLLAIEEKQDLSGEEFQTLNLCLDDAIAEAVTEFSTQREGAITAHGNERLGALAHEIRNALTTVMLTFDSMKGGRVPVAGSTGMVLERNLLHPWHAGGAYARRLAPRRGH